MTGERSSSLADEGCEALSALAWSGAHAGDFALGGATIIDADDAITCGLGTVACLAIRYVSAGRNLCASNADGEKVLKRSPRDALAVVRGCGLLYRSIPASRRHGMAT